MATRTDPPPGILYPARIRAARGTRITIGWWPALMVAAVTAYTVLTRPPGPRLADLDVYLGAAADLRAGQGLYDFILGDAPFTYPPFAGLLFLPLTEIPRWPLQIAWTAATILAVIALARLTAHHVSAPVIALALFLSAPVSSDLRYGQVSLFLALMVTADVLMPGARFPSGAAPQHVVAGETRPRRTQGVLIGLAAAVKLTPLIFIPMLWLRGERRAALTATGTFALCAAAAAAILPAESWRYWTTEVRDVNRLGHILNEGNQSLNAAFLRLGVDVPVLVLVLGAAVVGLALHHARTADPLTAVVVTGAAGVVFSPVSWTHHQVWLVLAAFLPVRRAERWTILAVMVLPVIGNLRLLVALYTAGRSRLTTLPVALRGSADTKTTSRGTQNRASRDRT